MNTFIKLFYVVMTICNPQTQECEKETISIDTPTEHSCTLVLKSWAQHIYKADGYMILGEPECKSRWVLADGHPIETCTLPFKGADGNYEFIKPDDPGAECLESK